ncbi:MAG: sigma-54-dependent Fis family transcriptional regulator [Rhodospirillaceae bacterium]|nr:sigma-54-dependent Fis family transcriptional regulator [Rhodospirillaceae bacterium]
MTRSREEVLLVEETRPLARVYGEYLRDENLTVTQVETGAAALAVLAERVPDAVLLETRLPDMDGLDVLRHITANRLQTVVVMITAQGTIGNAVEAMRAGADDFLCKPFNADRLRITVRNALERRRLKQIVATLNDTAPMERYCRFIGRSPCMQAVYRTIERAATSRATVFVTGESGTGKELCAEAIHQRGPRADGPFVALNCAAIPRDLMESEMFGHVRGAFTGAHAKRDGAARRAHGGTLFLDEICEMDLGLQTKLLRFIQTETFQKVGGHTDETVDVRFVCATNRNPLKEIEAGRFREDLYYRLHVIPVTMPPLRERGDDVLAIARHCLAAYAEEEGKSVRGFTREAEERLRNYTWPGNVRQLQNVLRHLVVVGEGDEITAEMLPHFVTEEQTAFQPPLSQPGMSEAPANGSYHPLIRPLVDVEREAVERAIAACDGNIPRAATYLGISPSTIYRKRSTWRQQGC